VAKEIGEEAYGEHVDRNVYASNYHLLGGEELWEILWHGSKVQVILCRVEVRLLGSLLIILTMTTPTDSILKRLHVKPPLLASSTIVSHLFRRQSSIELLSDRCILLGKWRLQKIAGKDGRRHVELARGWSWRPAPPRPTNRPTLSWWTATSSRCCDRWRLF
jgi:hypothetical protein